MIAPIEVAPASSPGQIKVTRVTQMARKQLVFRLTDGAGQSQNLKEEVQNVPAEVADWFPQQQAVGSLVKIRLRNAPPAGSGLYGPFTLDVEGEILDQSTNRGFVSFQLNADDLRQVGIFECYIERYLPNGAQPGVLDDGWRIDTWPLLLAIEPTAMGLLNGGGAKGPLLIPEVRLAMLDVSDQNDGAPFSNLLDDTEFTDLDIVFAQQRVVQLWNETPPPITFYTTQNFPYRYNWLECTVGHLLLASAQRYRKNRLAYQAGGIAIDDQSKAEEYQTIGQEKIDRFREWMRNEKYRINMNSCWATGL